ncbi:ABC transporter transmembrane domain-containing protein [Planomonospora algeriensis]
MRSSDRLLARIVRRGGPWLGVLAVTAVTGALAQLALPFVLGRTVDALVSGTPSRGAWLGACAAIVVAAVAVACDALGVWATGACSTRASEWLRHLTVRHVLGAGPALHRRFSEGELATRAGVNAEEAGRAPETLVTGAALVVPTAGGLVALTLIDPWLTLTLAAGLVAIVLVLRSFLRVSTTLAGGYQEAQGDIAARLTDALAGARTIAAAGTHAEEKARVLAPLPRLRAHAMEMWRTNAARACRPVSWCRCWRWRCSGWGGSASPRATSPRGSSIRPPATSSSAPGSVRRWATWAAWPGRAPPRGGSASCSPNRAGPTAAAPCLPAPAPWS